MPIEITGGTGAPGPAGPAGPATTGLPATYLLRVNALSQVEAYDARPTGGSVAYTGATLDVVLSSIVTALAGAAATLAFAPQTFALAADPNLPASIGVALPKGALLSHGANALTIKGHIAAGPYQVFSGTGTVSPTGPLEHVYQEWWGAKGDGIVLTDVSATNASAVVNSASANFSSADVGKVAVVYDPVSYAAVNNNGQSVTTAATIASVQSATQCTLSVACTETGTGLVMVYGSDDTAPVQAAINAAAAIKAPVRALAKTYVGGTGTTIVVGGSNQGLIWQLMANTTILGAGKGKTIYASCVYHQNTLTADAVSNVHLADLTARSDGTGADGVKIFGTTTVKLRDVEGVNGSYPVQIIGCKDVDLDNVTATGAYYDSGSATGGYGVSVADVASLGLAGTRKVRIRGGSATGCQYGALRLIGDAAASTKPADLSVSDFAAYQCGQAGGGYGAFLLSILDAPRLANCTADSCDIGLDLQGGQNRAQVSNFVATKNREQGIRCFGSSSNEFANCRAYDNNQANGGLIGGISMQDDGSAVGSTNNSLTNCHAGVTTWRQVTDGVTTSGSPNVSSATASFASTDVGMVIVAGTVVTTIASVTDSSHAVMAANASATATGVTVQIGTAPAHQGYQCTNTHSGKNNLANCDFSSAYTSTINSNGGAGQDRILACRGLSDASSGTLTVGASPWTHSAGPYRELIVISGGTVSSVTIGGVATGITTPGTLVLEPGDAMVVTYSVAPTVYRRSA